MKKTEVLAHFSGTSATGKALGISKSTVSLWGEKVPWQYALLISEITGGSLKFSRADYSERFGFLSSTTTAK
ncbi:Cro/CI family transcriptional regulator [Yersinia wautersii]|uniref:DNA-binding transcriptional regulator DicC n=1 Tax=Yersinia pseudotuberculosis TaxID=633 RepID=A0A380Q9Q4_YERPU|nr:Cro/CI family transcriptional regulator [Yersinia pseudotuberculosis]SUP83796.1 DNA-binding transcriptional regulator DicC [Yersinia pseudotuberculosis]